MSNLMGNNCSNSNSASANSNSNKLAIGSDKCKIKVFISYSWHYRKDDVQKMAQKYLKNDANLDIWLDIEKMSGFIFETMAVAIDQADVVVVFFGSDYVHPESNSWREFQYAILKKKPLLLVRIDQRYKPDGAFALATGAKLWTDYREELACFETDGERIVQHILKAFETPQAFTNLTPPKNRFTAINSPFFQSAYYSRPEDEDKILALIVDVCNVPGRGVVVICGDGGIGKTTIVSQIISNKKEAVGLEHETVVLWFNCYKYRDDVVKELTDDAKKEFNDDLVRLMKRTYPDFDGDYFRSILPFFLDKKLKKVLFVLDDMFNTQLYEHFIREQTRRSDLSCVVITRNPVPLMLDKAVDIREKYIVQALKDEGVQAFFETACQLRDKLTPSKLIELAKKCCGLPLIASLFWKRFQASMCRSKSDHDRECDTILQVTSLASLETDDKERSFKTVLEMFKMSLNAKDARELRFCYYVFLLFDPLVPIEQEDLTLLWSLIAPKLQPHTIRNNFLERSLVRLLHQEVDKSSKKSVENGPLLVHQMLHEAAREVAAEDYGVDRSKLNNDKEAILQAVRMKILQSSANGEMLLFEVTRKLKSELLHTILLGLNDVDVLTDVLLEKQKPTIDETAKTFIHFLYSFENWPENLKYPVGHSRESTGLNVSYRLLARLLLKIKRQQRRECLRRIERSGGDDGSFLFDLFNDEKKQSQYWDRYDLVILMSSSRPWYEFQKWRREKLADKNTSKALVATIKGDLEGVERNFEPDEASSIIVAGARSGFLAILEYLIVGRKISLATCFKDYDGPSPLWMASQLGHLDVVKFIYESYPLSISMPTINCGMTPLWIASQNGHLEVIKYIFEKHCASISTPKSDDGRTPLWVASQNGHLDVIKFIFEKHPESISIPTSDDRVTPLWIASRHGHIDVVKFIFDKHPESISTPTSDCYATPLLTASQNGHLDVVKFVFQKHPESISTPTSDSGRTPLLLAAQSGHLEIVKFIAQFHPSSIAIPRSDDGELPLHVAASMGHLSVVDFLAKSEPSSICKRTFDQEATPLWLASANGHLHVVKRLADLDVKCVSLPDKNGRSPLIIASQNGHRQIATYLSNLIN